MASYKEHPRIRAVIIKSGFELDDIINGRTLLGAGRRTITQAKKMKMELKKGN